MATAVAEPEAAPARPAGELAAAARWLNLVAAGVIYTCTNPGRTYGLGVITEELLKDFSLTRTEFGQLNFWATVVVALLSFGDGTLVDLLGLYRAAALVTAAVAASTALTAAARDTWTLFAAVALARLFGPGILALVSTALLGKSLPPRRAPAMGVHVVVYFSIWAYAFGRRDLAQIQGAIHVVTIAASGAGPLVFAICRDRTGSYLACLDVFAWVILALGVAMLFVRVPCADRPPPTIPA